MINVIDIYQDSADRINVEENGQFSYSMFNRFSKLAELRLLEWLSGDISAIIPPEPFRSQKNDDWLSPFIVKYASNVTNGQITRPVDYYLYQDLYSLSGSQLCDDDTELVIEKRPVKVLPNSKFYQRVATYIQSLKPSIKKPIAKQTGKDFEFAPSDIGSVTLEYVRYPKFASIAKVVDEQFMEEVPDIPNCVNYEWDEWAREILVFFICDSFANRTREQALKSTNIITGKTIRDSKQ
jgi:hypothetical protein